MRNGGLPGFFYDITSCFYFITTVCLCVGCHYNALNETAAQQHTIEACKLKFEQLIQSLFLLHIDRPIHKDLLSDWLHLNGRDSPLIA